MRHFFLLFISLTIAIVTVAQVAPNKYLVRFTDKDNTPYSINDPAAFLSERAIARRVTQDIPIEENDLPVDPDYIQQVVETGVTLLNVSKWFNSVLIYTTDQNALDEINAFPFVLSVEKSTALKVKRNDDFEKPFFANELKHSIPDEALLKSTGSGNSYDYGYAFNQIDMLNGIGLHDLGYAGQGMIIAVLDAGFENADDVSAFDYLWENERILGYRDFVNPQNPNIFNSHYHGTRVLSTMGAYLPGEFVGTAPEASFYLLRTEDGGSEYIIEEYNWVSGAEFADSVGADVLNTSLGYSEFDDPSMDHSYEDLDGNTVPITIAADIAASKGMMVVNSAGNSGNSAWQYVTSPADGDSVFTIGAVDGSGQYASFSSTGPTYDGRIKPNVVAQGSGTAIIDEDDGSVTFGAGTSYSSPISAGMVACLWQAHPGNRNTEIMAAIEQSGSLADDPNYQLGYGIPDYLMAHGLVTDTGMDIEAQSPISVYPVPFNDHLIISMDEVSSDPVRISLVDVTGKVIIEEKVVMSYGIYKLDNLGQLPAGVYFARVTAGQKDHVQKVIR
jgi:subtilisin family serine protease